MKLSPGKWKLPQILVKKLPSVLVQFFFFEKLHVQTCDWNGHTSQRVAGHQNQKTFFLSNSINLFKHIVLTIYKH